jgi:hypothetical protein
MSAAMMFFGGRFHVLAVRGSVAWDLLRHSPVRCTILQRYLYGLQSGPSFSSAVASSTKLLHIAQLEFLLGRVPERSLVLDIPFGDNPFSSVVPGSSLALTCHLRI